MSDKLIAYGKYLTKWVEDYCQTAKTKGVIVGISGGVDSALVATLCSLSKKIKVLGVWMDIDNSSLDITCMNELKNKSSFSMITLDLKNIFNVYKETLSITNPLSLANLKARIRMSTLYALAQENNLLVAGTGNADELYMGYFTKYGDGGCDILPLAYLNKSQVFLLAEKLGVPKIIVQRTPTAGLYQGQSDEKEMGITYKEIDAFLAGKKVSDQAKKIINSYHNINSHKFNMPIKPKKFS